MMSVQVSKDHLYGVFIVRCDYGCGETICGATAEAAESFAKDAGWIFIHCREDGKTYHYCRTCANEGA